MRNMIRVNGYGTKGQMPPRFVLERNVMDMLEGNEKYGNLSFCDAQDVVDLATVEELLEIYNETLDPEKIDKILSR